MRRRTGGIFGLQRSYTGDTAAPDTPFPVQTILFIANLLKTHASGFQSCVSGYQALKTINLDVRCGETFALLGPTTLPLHGIHEPANIS
jgi:hypothetical protein